jgi:hypothetical protein
VSSINDENQDSESQDVESSQEADEPSMETSKKKAVLNTNHIKVTRTKMKHLNKIKQLHRIRDLSQTERRDKSSSPVENDHTPESSDSRSAELVTKDQIISDLTGADPTVLPPQDELLCKQTTTEDVTTLLNSSEDFGSTKELPQALLQLRPDAVGSTSSGSLISLLSDSSENEYLLSTNKSGEVVSEVQTSGNNVAIISDSDSLITIISISDDPVMSVGDIAPSTSVSDDSDVVVAVLESTEADDMMAKTIFSDIQHENLNNGADKVQETSDGGSSKQVLVKLSDLKCKQTVPVKKNTNLIVSKDKQ